MATGDVTLFEEFADMIGESIFNFSSDTLKLGIIDNNTPPTAADASPRWGDYVGDEVATTGNYTANGESLTTVLYTEAAGVATLDADSVTILQDAVDGFTLGYWGILYSDTAGNDEAFAFVEMGGPVSEKAGPIVFNWDALGTPGRILTVTVNP
jgi:hypothetical protein